MSGDAADCKYGREVQTAKAGPGGKTRIRSQNGWQRDRLLAAEFRI